MVVNAYLLAKRGALESIASKLAPTEDHIRLTEQHYAETAGLFYARLSVQVWINLAKVAIGTLPVAETGKMDSSRFLPRGKKRSYFCHDSSSSSGLSV